MVYVKQHPVMFGTIFVVFGLFLWLMLNRGANSGSVSTTVVTPQPSDAQIAAGLQLQTAQLDANTQVALGQISLAGNRDNNQTQTDLATLALQASLAQIQSDHDLGNAQIEASLGALSMQLANNLAITHDNNQFMIDYAKNAQDAATMQVQINAALQAELSKDQLKAYTTGAMLAQIPNINKNNRDELLTYIAGVSSGDPNAAMAAAIQKQTQNFAFTYNNGNLVQIPGTGTSSEGGFNPLSFISPVTNLIH